MKRLIILLLVAGSVLALALNRQKLFPAERNTASHPGTGSTAPALAANVAPLEVEVAKVEKLRWQPYLETVGSITAVNGVTVTTDLGGRVVQIGFDSGSEVRNGTLLVQLDIEREKAQLAQAEAKRDLSRLNLERSRNLLGRHTISQSEYDAAEADLRQNEGAVREQQAIIARKTIRARFDGLAGIRQVNVGQYLNPGQPVVTLQSVDPVYVDFELPQEQLSKVTTGLGIEAVLDAYPETFRGTITAINSEIEADSRHFKVRATLPNPDRKLRPGMFAKVDVQSGAVRDVIAVPLSAVKYAPYGDSVFIVTRRAGERSEPSENLEQHFVKLGQVRGDRVAVLSGVQAGEEVVTAEVFRLRNGAAVRVRRPDGGGTAPAAGPASVSLSHSS
ncbi:MAG: efflux RND transporter periplasmic adaptor subunit [Verrucomicrobia bacterium]|nr:efflux RND transporter periplasmic adaptor subunit [Verrucomicrobiota bacterium]